MLMMYKDSIGDWNTCKNINFFNGHAMVKLIGDNHQGLVEKLANGTVSINQIRPEQESMDEFMLDYDVTTTYSIMD